MEKAGPGFGSLKICPKVFVPH